jgi:hypothetical protein
MNNETDAEVGDYKSREMTGKEFCTFFPNLSKRLVKLTNKTEIHNGFQFKTGLNEDIIPFDPTGECKPGGIYFTDIGNIARWIEYGGNEMKYCRTVTLPSDCRVYIEDNKFKADKIELDERVEISDLPCWLDNDFCLNALIYSDHSLNYINYFNKELQIEAVKIKPYSIISRLLKLKIDISEEIQLIAVQKNWRVLSCLLGYKVDVPEEVQIAAVKKEWSVIQNLINYKVCISKAVYFEAIKTNPRTLQYLLDNRVLTSLDDIPEEVREKAEFCIRKQSKILSEYFAY